MRKVSVTIVASKGFSFTKKSKRSILHIVFGRTMIILALLALQFFILFGLMFSAEKYIPYLFGSISAFTAIMLIIVLNTAEDASVKLSWCFFIGIMPVFGALMYLFIRLDIGHRLEQKTIKRMLKMTAGYLPENTEVYSGITDKRQHNLAKYLKNNSFTAYSGSDATYFPLGEDKFKRVIEELEKAERFIFLEYFIIKEGRVWESILEVLKRKAAEGVDVRVYYDGTNTVLNLPYGYAKQLQRYGIKCKMHSPLRPFVSTHYNNRDHRKILIIDSRVAFTGGVNIGDEYANVEHPLGHWKDTAVMVTGEAVNSFTLMFLQMWCCNEKDPDIEKYLCATRDEGGSGTVIPYADNPMDSENVGENVYLDIINGATEYVYIMTPYLIIDGVMEQALCYAAKRGVDVRLILPSRPDHAYAFALAKDHFSVLLDAGVKIYSYSPGFIHAKVFLSDGAVATVGSINLDYRSLYLHFECGCLFMNAPIINDIFSDFEDTFTKCRLVTREDIKKRSLISRLAAKILKAAAPLM